MYDRANYLGSYLDKSQSSVAAFSRRRLINVIAGAAGYENSLLALDDSIEKFKQSLPSLSRTSALSDEQVHSLLLIHCLANCATIQLHRSFVSRSSTSMTRCLTSANIIVRVTQDLTKHVKVVNPIVGVCTTFCLQTMLHKLKRELGRSSQLPQARFWCMDCAPSRPRAPLGRHHLRSLARKDLCSPSEILVPLCNG